jgi:hypothetical protein
MPGALKPSPARSKLNILILVLLILACRGSEQEHSGEPVVRLRIRADTSPPDSAQHLR